MVAANVLKCPAVLAYIEGNLSQLKRLKFPLSNDIGVRKSRGAFTMNSQKIVGGSDEKSVGAVGNGIVERASESRAGLRESSLGKRIAGSDGGGGRDWPGETDGRSD